MSKWSNGPYFYRIFSVLGFYLLHVVLHLKPLLHGPLFLVVTAQREHSVIELQLRLKHTALGSLPQRVVRD